MKKSFILYSDQVELFKKLSPIQTKDLILKIFNYTNGSSYNPDDGVDPIVDIAFTAIKLSLDRDMETYHNICERNRINGLRGGRPPKPKKPSGLSGNPKNPEKPKKADSDSDSDNEIDKKNPPTPHGGNDFPKWLDPILFKDFIEHRKKLRKPMTEKAQKLFISKLSGLVDKGYPPSELIETAIERGWQTVFEPKEKTNGKQTFASEGFKEWKPKPIID